MVSRLLLNHAVEFSLHHEALNASSACVLTTLHVLRDALESPALLVYQTHAAVVCGLRCCTSLGADVGSAVLLLAFVVMAVEAALGLCLSVSVYRRHHSVGLAVLRSAAYWR